MFPIRLVSAIFIAALAFFANPASAACTSPAGVAGQITLVGGVAKSCDGTTWGSVGGTAAVSSLSDVTLTSLANNQLLQYNSGTSKWVNVSPSATMTTTTMSAGWPDAIMCTSGGTYLILYHNNSNGTVD